MDFRPDPPCPFGDLKNPLGHLAGPSGPPLRPPFGASRLTSLRPPLRPTEPAWCPRGFFKSPNGRGGSGRKSMIQNQNFVYIFFQFLATSNIAYILLPNLKRRSTQIFSYLYSIHNVKQNNSTRVSLF